MEKKGGVPSLLRTSRPDTRLPGPQIDPTPHARSGIFLLTCSRKPYKVKALASRQP